MVMLNVAFLYTNASPTLRPIMSQDKHYSLYINCGGKEVTTIDNRITYKVDLEARGASMFYARPNWAISSTCNFLDDGLESDNYIYTNVSSLQDASELYKTARASPMSLTYYGLCLINGKYTVKLHFAEVVFANDGTFNSLGQRLFDVYLQVNIAKFI
ncbi:hypothetical protein RD792_006428 [Penstemon davidsonii]|uniref:Malectin domain-containing protein n=1 Tax=Penstemon davidsonii TaxID=160366 RepID=A0ABR0DCX8_9LAMI|nr:hypothetical protein RD792_006428 [Penstemon davidsonii]